MSLAYALLWQRYMAVSARINGDAVNRSADSPCYLNVVHSGRTLIDRPCYIGNVVCPIYVIQSLEELLSSPICKVAETIASNLHSLEKPSWQAFLLLLQDPERYAKYLSIFGNPDTMQLTFSNVSRLKFFDADFGFGRPEYFTVYPMMIPGFATWAPLTKEGGALISWNIPQNIYDELKRDELFQKYVDVMY
ncbi:hypothetical protein GGI12_004281 [Dipsacomyces acuminosporus]|nr:hypothetical protein GGI12_004281 [Dipsacomyces acuminosporus]